VAEDGRFVVNCYGISQDPTTKNHLMVMGYKECGNLRECLQNKDNELSLGGKLEMLWHIADGLDRIHQQNLVHQDFHSGNILNSGDESHITDLGLSRPVNHPKQTGKIFGVLPYVAPEVLRGKFYTKASDIYS
jgi:serine/threonine protein kinase